MNASPAGEPEAARYRSISSSSESIPIKPIVV
jgi:hypothetical protein